MNIHPVFPSILSTNYFDLQNKLQGFDENHIDVIHLDVMDGHFVDNISFGPAAVRALKSTFHFQVDAHLMITNPGKMIPHFIAAGAEWISIHVETETGKIKDNLDTIKKHNRRAGLVINPDTPVEFLFPFLGLLDYVLLMSVYPGFGGQKFIESTVDKVSLLKKRIQQEKSTCLIQVDGGVKSDIIQKLKAAGADLFVIGTFLYNSENMKNTLDTILNLIKGTASPAGR